MKFDQERFEELQAARLSAGQIADRMHCSQRTVTRWRAKLGVSERPNSPFASQPISPDRLERARLMFEDDASRREVGRSLGMSYVSLVRHFPDAKWDQVKAGKYARMLDKLNRIPNGPPIQTSRARSTV